MYEALTILVRYSMIAFATYLATQSDIDHSLIEPLAALAVAVFAVIWMVAVRFKKLVKKWLHVKDSEEEIEEGIEE